MTKVFLEDYPLTSDGCFYRVVLCKISCLPYPYVVRVIPLYVSYNFAGSCQSGEYVYSNVKDAFKKYWSFVREYCGHCVRRYDDVLLPF